MSQARVEEQVVRVPAASSSELAPAELKGKTVAMIVFSGYPGDPRPRRCAEALARAGMTVDVICEDGSPDYPRHEELDRISILRLPISRRRGGSIDYMYRYSAFILMSSFVTLFRWWRRRYDLVYIHNMPDVLVVAGLIPKLLGSRVILDLHDPMPELLMTIFGFPERSRAVRLLKILERWSIGLADRVVTVNRACARMFADRSCSAEKVTVVMNSPDEAIFDSSARAPERTREADRPFVVMYHGSIVERNGLGLAVQACAKIRAAIPKLEFRVYGSNKDPFLERVLDSARQMGLDSVVRYMGLKSLEEIAIEIEQCDVGIIPNERSIFTEINTPTRIFEYLAKGKPVIAPRSQGICDYFDESSLVFFELGNADDLASKIEFVHRCPEDTARIAKRGTEVYRGHTWTEERGRLTELVRSLFHESAAAR
jgi:glycosyltransferase involved in cell wall biosynthesis